MLISICRHEIIFMKTTFTITEILSKRGCYHLAPERIIEYAEGRTQITVEFIINHPRLTIIEKGWFLSNHTELTAPELAQFAHGCYTHATPTTSREKAYYNTFPDPLDTVYAATKASETNHVKLLAYMAEFFSC